jgi:hypothetical protein
VTQARDPTTADDLALYRTLDRIDQVLQENPHEFINLSVGPDLPIEDDEIHPWTALLDSWLADGKRLLTIAAGNNGNLDRRRRGGPATPGGASGYDDSSVLSGTSTSTSPMLASSLPGCRQH